MKIGKTALPIATALLLAGCANGFGLGFHASATSDAHGDGTTSELTVRGQDALYIGIVDGLIKQNRDGAALAFLDGYRQIGETLSPRYWLLRGNALSHLHRDSEAIQAFSELRETPLESQGWNGIGRIAAEKDNWIDAEQSFRKAADGDPTNADFLNNLAFAELNLNKADDATTSLQQAHELEPGSDRILVNLVIALTVRGDNTQADAIIADIEDVGRRDAMRAVVKSAVVALNTKGKS
jgi:tetratricopeptide (TPR) repeat protein